MIHHCPELWFQSRCTCQDTAETTTHLLKILNGRGYSFTTNAQRICVGVRTFVVLPWIVRDAERLHSCSQHFYCFDVFCKNLQVTIVTHNCNLQLRWWGTAWHVSSYISTLFIQTTVPYSWYAHVSVTTALVKTTWLKCFWNVFMFGKIAFGVF